MTHATVTRAGQFCAKSNPTPVPQVQLDVVQGDTFRQDYLWRDSNKVNIDLTGYTARLQVRQFYTSPAFLFEVTESAGIALGGVAGTVEVTFTPAQTVLMKTDGVYDLELTDTGGVVTTIAGGRVSLTLEVTR